MYLVGAVLDRRNQFLTESRVSNEQIESVLRRQAYEPKEDTINTEYLEDVMLTDVEKQILFKDVDTQLMKIVAGKDPNNIPPFEIAPFTFDEVTTRRAFTLAGGKFVPNTLQLIQDSTQNSNPTSASGTVDDGSRKKKKRKRDRTDDEGRKKKKKKKKHRDREGGEGENGEKKKKKKKKRREERTEQEAEQTPV